MDWETKHVHPDDYPALIDPLQADAICLAAAPANVKRPEWSNLIIDLENAGQDGDPMADIFCEWERGFRAVTFETPDMEFVEPGHYGWPELKFKPRVLKGDTK